MSKKSTTWDDHNYLRAYLLARAGEPDSAIAAKFGVSSQVFKGWQARKPALVEALSQGRQNRSGGKGAASFRDYVYSRLPDHLQDLWERIHATENARNGLERLERLLADAGERARQELYIYALVHCSFNPSEACRCVNVSRSELKRWAEDPDFAQLLEEMDWHKGNFFEEALVDLVQARDPTIVRFANSTFNRERGYGEKLEVNHNTSHVHAHLHAEVDMDRLLPMLRVETRKEILEAMRQLREGREAEPLALPAPPMVVLSSRPESVDVRAEG